MDFNTFMQFFVVIASFAQVILLAFMTISLILCYRRLGMCKDFLGVACINLFAYVINVVVIALNINKYFF